MFTPPKAAPALLGVLALAFVAGTVQAENKAVWTSKRGWSAEHSCEKDGERTRCWTLTRGKSVFGDSGYWAASLTYECDTMNREWLAISFTSSASPRRDNPTLRVRWYAKRREDLREEVRTESHTFLYGNNRVYHYYIVDTHSFLSNVADHRYLYVFLPFRHRPEEVKFSLKNAIPSIEATMKACHIHRSALGDIAL